MRRDPGLAAERTQLAWQRFALSLAVIGALGLRAGLAHHHSTLGFATAALLGAAAAGLQLRGPRMAARSAIRAALAATLLAAALALALAGPASAAPFHGCPGSDTWLCARVTVPLDRSGAVRGNVHLVVERLRARRTARTAVMGFPGGPGAATLSGRDGWLRDLAPSLGGRDLLLFDQRGIGRSDYLQCGVYVGLVPPLAVTRLASAKSVQRCAQRLGDRRRFYTTRDTVEDIESVRQAAHVDKLVLVGVSYGTRTALAYAAAHPDHVERIVLDSVVAPDGVDAYLLDTLRAVPRVLGRLCRGGGCDGITSDPTADLRALVARLEQKPLRLHRPIDFFGCHFRPAVTRSAVLDTLVAGDLEDPLLRAAVPAAIKAALEGDAEPLAVFGIGQDDLRLVLCLLSQIGLERPVPGLPLDRGDSEAAYVATLCGDGPLPWTTSTPFSRRRRAAEDVLGRMSDEAFAPFDRATALASETLNICKFWPEAGPGPPADADPLPALPALVLSGEDDLRTPTETAREVAGRIPGAQFLPVPDHGHSLVGSSGCAARALVRFMAGGEAAPCHDPPQHSPKPLTALQLRCFVYVSELVGKRPRRHPSARLARCARVLAPVVPNGLPKPSAAAGTGRTY